MTLDTKRMHRSLIIVERIYGRTLQVNIPNWNPYVSIEIPDNLICEKIIRDIEEGTCLLGYVNIEAERRANLRFKDINEMVSSPS